MSNQINPRIHTNITRGIKNVVYIDVSKEIIDYNTNNITDASSNIPWEIDSKIDFGLRI